MPKLAEPTARKAARQIMKRRWRQLGQRARRLRQRRDRARLHDFRVALRRMRATLALCDQQLGLAARKTRRRAIKELAAASGTLRDWEILRAQLAELWPVDADASSPFAQNCAALLDLAQLRAERHFARIFHEHKTLLKEKIRIRQVGEHDGAVTTMQQAVGLYMLHLLHESTENALSALLLPEPLHALRLTAKNLRYTLESVAEPGAESILDELRRVQEHLGGIHDIDQTIVALRRWEPQLVQPGVEDSALQYDQLLRRAFELRTARVAKWLHEFPSNGADLFARLQERAGVLAAGEEPATVLA